MASEEEAATNQWFLEAIAKSRFEERLRYIAEVISDDKKNGAAYTKDAAYMQQLRDAWVARSDELRRGNQ